MNFLFWTYTAVASLAATWAWATDIAMLNSSREHMLPDIIFLMVASPLALTLDPLYRLMPSFFDLPFTQLAYMTICAAVQTGCLRWLFRKKSSALQRD